jgi:hypothetical protein
VLLHCAVVRSDWCGRWARRLAVHTDLATQRNLRKDSSTTACVGRLYSNRLLDTTRAIQNDRPKEPCGSLDQGFSVSGETHRFESGVR